MAALAELGRGMERGEGLRRNFTQEVAVRCALYCLEERPALPKQAACCRCLRCFVYIFCAEGGAAGIPAASEGPLFFVHVRAFTNFAVIIVLSGEPASSAKSGQAGGLRSQVEGA